MIFKILQIIFPILITTFIGYIYDKKEKISIDIFIPILVFYSISQKSHFTTIVGTFPPAFVNSLMAEKYGHNTGVILAIVIFGNIISLLIISIVFYFTKVI